MNFGERLPAAAGDRFLSILPSWHAYERAVEYFTFTSGIEQVYSNVKKLKDDLKRYSPQYLVSVPLVYEILYSSIKKQLSSSSAARKFVALLLIRISFLYMDAKRIYEAIGVKLQNGYGLTETSPIVACRSPDNNVLGTVGHPLNFTEIMIVDLKTGRSLPDGSKGIVKVRGPQIMKGYYKYASATGEAIDKDGWFNSGDVGWIVPKHSVGISRQCGGMLVIEGRAKDTIVLSTGENVDPSELEEAVIRSNLIQHIVVIGQDQRRLGAIVVPNMDEVLASAKNLLLIDDENPDLSKDKMLGLLHDEVRNWTKDCSFSIGPIMIVDEPFTIENGLLTPTLKVRRQQVIDRYRLQIANLYK